MTSIGISDNPFGEQSTQPRSGVEVSGWTSSGFEGVREAFETNIRIKEENQATFALYWKGEQVVDLCSRDSISFELSKKKNTDPIFPIFSVTKALTSFALMHLVQDGLIDLDCRMSHIWPEFGQFGKDEITVRQVASHQAGLPAFDTPMTILDLMDWEMCVEKLSKQSPRWLPGSKHGYHAITFGYLLGEIIRRISGESVGKYFSQILAAPLNLSAWIGLPSSEHYRVNEIQEIQTTRGFVISELDELNNIVMNNPPITAENFNRTDVWTAEMPAVNGISNARSLAKLFTTTLPGPLNIFKNDVISDFTRPLVDGPDLVLYDQQTRFGTGFLLPNFRVPMFSSKSFGHDGRGGVLAFADQGSNISYAYVTATANLDLGPDKRNTRILTAIRDALSNFSESRF